MSLSVSLKVAAVPEGCCPYDEFNANNVTSVNGVTDTHLHESLMARNVLGYSKM